MEYWGLTDPGSVRKNNQDCFLAEKLGSRTMIAVVCDGMGGARSGNVASKLASETFIREIRQSVHGEPDEEKAENALRSAIGLANAVVYENAKLSEDYQGMGTTLVAALVMDGTAVIANVGDSRAYLLNSNEVRCVTTDHSLVELMVQNGKLSREQAKTYPGKNYITRAIGTEPDVRCDVFRIPVQPGDNILLCSDGLSNFLADQEILFEAVHGADKSDCCQRLLQIVKQRGAPDNVTALLIAV